MLNRQLKIQKLHQSIKDYQPTEQQLQYLLRTYSQLKTTIQIKFHSSKINAYYRFPLSRHVTKDDSRQADIGTPYNLYKQNTALQMRSLCSSLEPHISHDHSLESDHKRGKKFIRQAVLETGSYENLPIKKPDTLSKKLRTEVSDYSSYNKQNTQSGYLNTTIMKKQLTKTKLTKMASSKQNKLNQTMKRQSSRHEKPVCVKKQKQRLDLTLSESSDAVLQIAKKLFPHSTKVNRSDYMCDFTQSYQFQNLSKLAESTLKVIDTRQNQQKISKKVRSSSKRQQFPYQKMYNEFQMKLLTNRISREGKSIKNNYRLIDPDTSINNKQLNRNLCKHN